MSGGAYALDDEVRRAVAERVSVIAVNFDGLEHLERFVGAVWASAAPPLELLVVDNGSTDGSQAWLAARDDVVLVEPGRNLGFGGGCDAGARAARGDLLLFANPDVAFLPDMLGALVGNLLAHPEVAISFPKMIDAGGHHEPEAKLEPVSRMAGAVMLVRRDHFEAIGGFDERMFLYWEDTDLCWRTRLAGREITQDWQAVAVHELHGTGGGPRWSYEQVANGLLAHLKARTWTATALFAVRMAAKTVVRGVALRDARMLSAWVRTVRRLRPVLAERRRLLTAAGPEVRADFERHCREYDRWRVRESARELRGRLAPAGRG